MLVMAGNTVKEMTMNFRKLDKFEGLDFRRWQKKMHFLLMTLKVVYVLTTPMPELWEDDTVEVIRIREKWENDDYICRGHILNGMSDSLFDVYQNVESARNYGILLNLKKSLRAQDSDKGKGKEVDGPSVNMTEDGKNKNNKQNKGKKCGFKENNSGSSSNKKPKLECCKCGQTGHFKRDCRSGNKKTQMLVVREKGLRTNPKTKVDAIAWWIDFGATTYVCKDQCWFKTYEPVKDEFVLYMGDDHFTPVYEKRSVVLEFSLGKFITLFSVLYVPKLRKNLISGPVLNKVDAITWWIDSGATTYVCKDRCWFKTYEPMKDGFVLYIDRGGEYYDPVFFQSVGIIHETTALYTPQQNGVDERKNRALKEMLRDQEIKLDHNTLTAIVLRKILDTIMKLCNLVMLTNDEIVSIMENNTCVVFDLLQGCKPLGFKWIFKRKMKVDVAIDKFKARLVVYVLTTPMPKLLEDDTMEAIRIRAKWENDNYICRRHIFNGMSDSLFDIYQNVESTRSCMILFESKYMVEDASSMKFLVKESLRGQDSDKGKGKEVEGPSVNMTEEGKNKNNKQYKGKKRSFKENNSGSSSNKKPKLECCKCGQTGHFKRDCRSGNKKNTNAGGSEKRLMLLRGGLTLVLQLMFVKIVASLRHMNWFYVIEPNNSIIESRDAIFDENRFSSIPRPKDIIPNSIKSQRDDHSNDVPSETPQPRKGKRVRKAKLHGYDFQLYLVKRSRDQVRSQYSYCYSIEEDPRTYNEVMQSCDAAFWKEATNDEIGSIMENNTCVLFDLPPGCKPLVIHQMDVKITFVNGNLDEEVYMKQPKWVVIPGNENKVYKLVKSFKFDSFDEGVIICLYVDEMLIFTTNQNQFDKTKKFLSSKFSMKDMGEVDVILGIKIKRKNKRIVITQPHYIEKILKKFNREDCSLVSTPMDPVEKLKPNTCKLVDQLEYSKAIGYLVYAMTSTRPDIAYAVGRLSRFTSNPRRHHYHEIIRASKKQTCISSSTTEYEFVALAATGKEAEWLRNLIHEILIWPKPITLIFIRCDSATTLAKAYS
uniref:CCHC-type domain-containing protein n=1 Tax=Tanacetum cinerariifolium TaxID=118510 RepID=A0A6L2NER3_TANCI|nr:hypothetical protein [Tanacetum cinerariifolium]